MSALCWFYLSQDPLNSSMPGVNVVRLVAGVPDQCGRPRHKANHRQTSVRL
jgi:hypothetical protein